MELSSGLNPRKIQKPDDNIDIENAKIIHYVGSSKPWYFWVLVWGFGGNRQWVKVSEFISTF